MDTLKILASSHVQVYRSTVAEGPPDIFSLVRVESRGITLKADRAEIRNGALRPGDILFLQSPTREALYRIQAKVIECSDEPEALLLVKPTGKTERIQRRRHFRLPIHLPAKVVEIREGESEVIRTETRDLSAAGMRIPYSRSVEPGQRVFTTLHLGDGDPPLLCQARIARLTTSDEGLPEVGIEFLTLSEADQDRLITHLTQKLRWSIRPIHRLDESL